MYFKEYVGILDSLFTRITSSCLDNDHDRQDLETFVESLWTTYKNGKNEELISKMKILFNAGVNKTTS